MVACMNSVILRIHSSFKEDGRDPKLQHILNSCTLSVHWFPVKSTDTFYSNINILTTNCNFQDFTIWLWCLGALSLDIYQICKFDASRCVPGHYLQKIRMQIWRYIIKQHSGSSYLTQITNITYIVTFCIIALIIITTRNLQRKWTHVMDKIM